jgi:hypothetical protein
MGAGPKVVAAAREFVVEVIEIPQVAKDRYFVLERMTGGPLRLVDDFVAPHSPWKFDGEGLTDELLPVCKVRSDARFRHHPLNPRDLRRSEIAGIVLVL